MYNWKLIDKRKGLVLILDSTVNDNTIFSYISRYKCEAF